MRHILPVTQNQSHAPRRSRAGLSHPVPDGTSAQRRGGPYRAYRNHSDKSPGSNLNLKSVKETPSKFSDADLADARIFAASRPMDDLRCSQFGTGKATPDRISGHLQLSSAPRR